MSYWQYLDAVVETRIQQSERRLAVQIKTAVEAIMSRTDDLSAELIELGTAVTDLDGRIAGLPTSVDEITQEQLDSLRASITKVTGLAQAAPEVPTDGTPTDGEPDVGL